MLDIAHARFAAHGYGAVTMEEVAAAAGVTKPLLYAYFGNKERLYLACLARAAEAMLATVSDAVRSAGDPAEALRRGLRAFFAFVDDDRDAWRVLFDETLPAGGEIAARVSQYRERLLDFVAHTLIARVPASHREHVSIEIEALSTAVLGAAEALARWWLHSGAIPAHDAAELLIATVEPGLQARAAGRGGGGRAARPGRGDGPAEQPEPATGRAGGSGDGAGRGGRLGRAA